MARDPDLTRQRILEAALEEFAEKGRAGARVETIAKRAEVSVRMLYVYFGDKDGLYDEVLRQHVAQRASMLGDTARPLGEFLPLHFSTLLQDPMFVRFMMWEALATPDAQEPIDAQDRYRRYEEVREYLDERKAAGELDPAFDSEMLLLLVIGAAAFPLAFSQVAKLVTGLAPTDPRFVARYEQSLRQLALRLAPPPESTPDR